MEIEILTKEKNMIELEFEDVDHSVLQLLVEKLNTEKDVEFVSYKLEHPVLRKPKFVLKTKKKEAIKLFQSALADAKKDLETFKKKFEQIVK